MSALVEIGNIMISSYVSAISKLTGISINLSVPAMSVNMLGVNYVCADGRIWTSNR